MTHPLQFNSFLFCGLVVACLISLSATADAQPSSRGSGSRQYQQGSGTQRNAGSGSRVVQKQPFHAAFWNYLTKGPHGYNSFGPFPGASAETHEGQSPHGDYLRLYANKTARKDPKGLPLGSILIKENYGPDRETLMAITVMYRSRDYDPENNDWYYIKYQPDGTVAMTPPEKGSKPIQGRFQSCIDCHGGAEDGDYVFAND